MRDRELEISRSIVGEHEHRSDKPRERTLVITCLVFSWSDGQKDSKQTFRLPPVIAAPYHLEITV